MNEEQTQLSQRVERDVRMLIGDLHMQLIVTKNALELAQGGKGNGLDRMEMKDAPQRAAI
jgi:hypothetical protein